MNKQQIQETISALKDPSIRRMSLDNPKAAYKELKSRGCPLPELGDDKDLKAVINTATKMYIVFPQISDDDLLDTESLSQIQAAGGGFSTVSTANITLSTAGSALYWREPPEACR